MDFSRRGFLRSLAVAVGTAAVFDPKTMLWTPAPVGPVELVSLALSGEARDTATAVQAVIDQQLELNALALIYAERLADRLKRHPSIALREVMYQHAGHVRLADTLQIEGGNVGRFEQKARVVVTTDRDVHKRLDDVVADLAHCVSRQQVDMFAPIGAELRPNEPFSSDTAIGVATDPASGLSVRVLQYQQEGHRGLWTDVEVAGGRWRSLRQERKEAEAWRRQYGDDD